MFSFAWPYIFLLLPLPWMIQKICPPKKKMNEAMLKIPFLSRIEALNEFSSASFSFPSKKIIFVLIWVSLLIACANPQWLGQPQSIPQQGRNIMLAIDLSKSMEIPDLQRNNQTLNRLDTIKEVAQPFIERRLGDKLGLILFGSKAYLQTPLTLDRTTVLNMLEDATIGLAGDRTAIGDAIGLAVKKFATESVKSRILILLTDGANNAGTISPIDAAQMAKENHIKIYTVGIGASEIVIQGLLGPQVVNPSADLDEATLTKMADLTGGKYFRAQDEQTLQNILDAINQLEPISEETHDLRPVTALFYWPLGFCLLFTLIFIFPREYKWRTQ